MTTRRIGCIAAVLAVMACGTAHAAGTVGTTLPAGFPVIEVHLGARGDRVAAQLVAREALLVEEEHPAALARQVPRARGARGARARDADVVEIRRAGHDHAPATAGGRACCAARRR